MLAVFNNLFYTYVVAVYFPYDGALSQWIHKHQLTLIALAGLAAIFDRRNGVNIYAFLAYIAIAWMNWIFDRLQWFTVDQEWSYIPITASVCYFISLIVILVIDKWKS